MSQQSDLIFTHLESVRSERAKRAVDPALAAHVHAVKRYQHDRLALTYADIQRQPRYAQATRFFLDDLYGSNDFSNRDAQFARIVPTLARLFKEDIVDTVVMLSELHALTETLDSAMGHRIVGKLPLDTRQYRAAWRAVGRAPARDQQIALLIGISQALDRHTHSKTLRRSLRLMRVPAKVAGLGALQSLLERGFAAFSAMNGSRQFLELIVEREQRFSALQFADSSEHTTNKPRPLCG